jgi:polyhydroxyalkanoate synthesis regulator protein
MFGTQTIARRRPGSEMRKINTCDFHVASRTTSRDINRNIALNLILEHEPISGADLARRMNMTRSSWAC